MKNYSIEMLVGEVIVQTLRKEVARDGRYLFGTITTDEYNATIEDSAGIICKVIDELKRRTAGTETSALDGILD